MLCIIEGKFSGANYQLEKEMVGRILGYLNPAGCIMLNGHAIKGILWARTILAKQENLDNRPKGTIILFKFPIANQSYLIKGFIFS